MSATNLSTAIWQEKIQPGLCLSPSTAIPEQREQASVVDFRSNTERDAELVRLRQEINALKRLYSLSIQQHDLGIIQRVVAACRSVVQTADEFLPDYPSAMSEPLDWLVTAVDEMARMSGGDRGPEPLLPIYEP